MFVVLCVAHLLAARHVNHGQVQPAHTDHTGGCNIWPIVNTNTANLCNGFVHDVRSTHSSIAANVMLPVSRCSLQRVCLWTCKTE
jgi:hypothetical protein